MNKLVYLELPILALSKAVTYEFCYDYVKPKYGEKAKLCYMDIDSFLVSIKTDDIADVGEDIETRFDTSNYRLNKPLLKGNNKKVISVLKTYCAVNLSLFIFGFLF